MKYIIRYGLVGLFSTLIHLSIAFLLIYISTINIVLINSIAFSIALLFSYICNLKIVFKLKFCKENFLKFVIVSLITFSIIIIVSYFGEKYNLNPYLIVVIITIIIPLLTFFLHKSWTFKKVVVCD